MDWNEDLSDLDDKKRIKMDSSCQETTDNDEGPTHPAVLIVFRTDNILEEICSYLELNDLKQFRLVSTTCNNEARRAIIKRDRHWVVVKSKNNGWELELDKVLTNLEQTTSAGGGANCSTQLLDWIFKRLLFVDWKHSLGHAYFFIQWGHCLRKVHFNLNDLYDEDNLDKESHTYNAFHIIKTMYNLLSIYCPYLDEMVTSVEYLENRNLTPVLLRQLDDLEFSSPLPNLKCLDIYYECFASQEVEVLQRFFTRLVIAAGSALEKLQIKYNYYKTEDDENNVDSWELMLDSISSNVGVSTFQCLQEITLEYAEHVVNLSYTVQNCFPKLTKLILRNFESDAMIDALDDPASYQVFPESFPALKSLTIQDIRYYCNITEWRILYFLQHFPNLEELTMTVTCELLEDELWIEIPDPIAPRCQKLRSLSIETAVYDLRMLRCVVKVFPNIVRFNLLEFGRDDRFCHKTEPEYCFGELIDAISPLNLTLKQLEVNHPFHTTPQLVNAIQLTSNLTALETLVLSQTAHDDVKNDFKVSLYLTCSDPDFQYILNSDCVKRLKSVQLLGFRFGTTQKEVEEEAAAKGGHVSFGTICQNVS